MLEAVDQALHAVATSVDGLVEWSCTALVGASWYRVVDALAA